MVAAMGNSALFYLSFDTPDSPGSVFQVQIYCRICKYGKNLSQMFLILKIPFVIFVCFLVLIDVSESPTDEKKPIDIYAIGFEEMVDLDAKNIMNTR